MSPHRLRNPLPGLALLAVLLSACASDPVSTRPGNVNARQASDLAASMVGKPYRYGGHHPSQGFDCSGLVYYSFRRAGLNVPRSTDSQRRSTAKVTLSHVSRGDLLFFNQEGKYSSHVGIYLGGDRFVHAPSSGKRVRTDSLSDPYWRKHLADVRRFF